MLKNILPALALGLSTLLLAGCLLVPSAPRTAVEERPVGSPEHLIAGDKLRLKLKDGHTLYMTVVRMEEGRLYAMLGGSIALSEVGEMWVQRIVEKRELQWIPLLLPSPVPAGLGDLASVRFAPDFSGQWTLAPNTPGADVTLGSTGVGGTGTSGGGGGATTTGGLGGGFSLGSIFGGLGGLGGFGGLGGGGGGALGLGLLPLLALAGLRRRGDRGKSS